MQSVRQHIVAGGLVGPGPSHLFVNFLARSKNSEGGWGAGTRIKETLRYKLGCRIWNTFIMQL
jgi:hypothetical protein